MGNRIQGFLAGVVVAGFATLTTSAAIKRHEAVNRNYLHQCNNIINNKILSKEPPTEPLPLNRRVLGVHRPSVAETCKDIWNDEIIRMTNWVYLINWYQWGLDIDRKVNRLVDRAMLYAEKN